MKGKEGSSIKPRAPATRNGQTLPVLAPRVIVQAKPSPQRQSMARVAKAASLVKTRVGKAKNQDVKLSYVGAGGGGLATSFPLMHLILTRGWMTPGWAGLAMAVLCTVGAYFGFKSGRYHVATAALGLGVGCGAIGGWTSLQAARMRAMAAKQSRKPPSSGDGATEEGTRNASESSHGQGRFSPERLTELEAELEAARHRLAAEVEMAIDAAEAA